MDKPNDKRRDMLKLLNCRYSCFCRVLLAGCIKYKGSKTYYGENGSFEISQERA